jgi:hypothetical protein
MLENPMKNPVLRRRLMRMMSVSVENP